jgi:hypothetical protein
MNPKCPNCQNGEFVNEPVSMNNGEYWNPVFCKKCGTIVGQLPSNVEKEAIERLAKISTLEEQLGDIKSLLLAFERIVGEKKY